MKKNQKLNIIIAIFAMIVLFTVFAFVHSNRLLQDERWVTRLSGSLEGQPDDLSFRLIDTDSSRTYRFEAAVDRDDFPQAPSGQYRLLIYRVAAESFKIRWNGRQIGTVGNLMNNRTNLWNTPHFIDIPPSLIRENNRLVLEMEASHQFGGIPDPLFIAGAHRAARMDTWFTFTLLAVTFLGAGFFLFAFILFLFLSSIIPGLVRREYLFYSLAALLMTVNLLDYVPFSSFPLPLLLTKKITLSALYLTVFFVQLGICTQFKIPRRRYLWFVSLFPVFLVILWLTPGAYQFKSVYRFTNLILLLANISWVWISARHFKTHEYARVLLAASSIMLAFSLLEIFSHLFTFILVFSMTVWGTMLFILGLSFQVIFDYLDVLKKLSMESRRADFHYNKSIRDGMTGLYNHNFIVTAAENIAVPYSIIMVDADHFKDINDNHGHEVGDEVIRLVAKTLSDSVRADDLVGRYGGDEFMMLLHNCPEEAARRVASKMAERLRRESGSREDIPWEVTLSVGIYALKDQSEPVETVVRKADQALYRAKQLGRDRAVAYSELTEEERAVDPERTVPDTASDTDSDTASDGDG